MAAYSDAANHPGGIPHPGAQGQADAQAPHDDEEGHTSFIKTPKQLLVVVVLSLAIPIGVILVLAGYVVNSDRTGAGADAMTPEAIEARIRPVAGFELRDASAPQVVRSGEAVYQAACGACHTAGVAGAPKSGDKEAWAPRIATGFEALVAAALKGKGAMPAQGGGAYSDLEISKAVVYMSNNAGATFDEPQAPAPAAQTQGEAKPEAK